ncbi:CHAT domain-containing protein [Xylaria curta]|nr:CHAT domain-containing protein [Xylaria curta]
MQDVQPDHLTLDEQPITIGDPGGSWPFWTWTITDFNEAIHAIREELQICTGGSQKHARLLYRLGIVFLRKYYRMGIVSDLEESILVLNQAVDITPDDNMNMASLLNDLANALTTRAVRFGSVIHIEKAVTFSRRAVAAAATRSDSILSVRCLYVLGTALHGKHLITGSMAVLEEALKIAREILLHDIESSDPSSHAQLLMALASALHDRFLRTGMADDLEEMIQLGKKSIAIDPVDSLNHTYHIYVLGLGLYDRYELKGNICDLNEAIRVTREAVNVALDESPRKPLFMSHLAIAICARYNRFGDMGDLEEAIQIARQAVAAAPYNDTVRSTCLSCLSIALGRYSRAGAMTDLDEAINNATQALAIIPSDSLARADLLNLLGNHLYEKFERSNEISDLEAAIRLIREAVTIGLPGNIAHTMLLNNLGIGLSKQYLKTGAMNDIEEAIDLGRQVLATTPESHVERAGYLGNLGARLRVRFRATGDMADINEAIELLQKSSAATPENHYERAVRLSNVALAFGSSFETTGAVDDIKQAVKFGREAILATPDGHPDLFVRLNNLGSWLVDMYSRIGAVADLEEAIQIGRRTLSATPVNHPARISALSNLANGLTERYLRTEVIKDLEDAIQFTKEAVAAVSSIMEKIYLLNNLGFQLHMRYKRLGELSDLDESIDVMRMAIDTSTVDHPILTNMYGNIQNKLLTRYEATGLLSNLSEAIKYGTKCLVATPPDHRSRAGRLNVHGIALCEAFLATGSESTLNESLECHQAALQQINSPPMDRLAGGGAVIRFSPNWEDAFVAGVEVINLVPKLISRSLTHSDRQHIFSQIAGIASDAAVAALRANQGPHIALSLLERGRGVLSSTLDDIRIDSKELQKTYPELAERLNYLQTELESESSRNSRRANNLPSTYHHTDTRQHNTELDEEFDGIIEEIRKNPGFEYFMRRPSREEIHSAASYGPIVVINITVWQCDAILVDSQQVRVLKLPCSKSDIEERVKQGHLQSPKALEWLWDAIASPILDVLGITGPPTDGNWPHIWWVPTGALGRVPLHAAGYHGRNSDTVLDRAMSSYSSSIRTILRGRQRHPPLSSTPALALLVAMDHPPDHPVPLPFVTDEIKAIRELCESMSLSPVEPEGSRQEIMVHLPECTVFHFAGHGYTDPSDPLQSHLKLGNQHEPLKVVDFLDLNIRTHSPFLAYLSACGTGLIEEDKFSDESIHLVSVCQLAGFRHVIGTMWEVEDKVCVEMATLTYEAIREGGLTDASVCLGLHKATRELRDRWLRSKETARIGDEPLSQRKRPVIVRGGTGVGIEDNTTREDDGVLRDWSWEGDDEQPTDLLNWVPYVHYGV